MDNGYEPQYQEGQEGYDGGYEDQQYIEEQQQQVDSGTQMRWSRPIMNGAVPRPRGGHTAIAVGSQIVVFGGHYYGGGGNFVYLNDVHVLDVETSTWHNVRCVGDVPAPRYGHSASLVGSRMYVFGGRGENGHVYKDMCFLDLMDWCWVTVNATTVGPPPRFNHAELLVGSKIVMFGGWDGKRTFNDLWVFDTEAFTWIKPKTAGLPPCGRQGHRMALMADGRVILFGGYSLADGKKSSYHSDTRELDTESMVWSKPRVVGSVPSGRYGLTFVQNASVVLMFGGWAGVRRCVLCNVIKEGRSTQPALDHQPDCVVGKSLYGYTSEVQTTSEYLHTLDTDAMQWEMPVFHGTPPIHRYGHTCTLVGNRAFIFGGWDGNQGLNDLTCLEINGPGWAVDGSTLQQ